MSLTISQPAKTDFGAGRFIHDFSPRISLAKSRLSPQPRVDSPLSTVRTNISAARSKMTTPHRGLPPPSAMTLPDPSRHSQSLSQSLGPLPGPPAPQWQDHQEESMRNWLAAKAEEDKRKQEEEKTKQESFKLEQRRIESSMLREALQGGIPPPMIPMIYAGIGGSSLATFHIDMLQNYAAQLQAAQQQLQHHSPVDARLGEVRMIGQPGPQYGALQPQQHQVVPSQPAEHNQQPGASQTTFSAYQPAPTRPVPTSGPRSATHTQLPRLTTNEMHVHQPPHQQGPGSAHPLQQSQSVQDQHGSSSPLYFHHWQPPTESKSNHPQTPASKGEPHSAHPGSHPSESDYRESPRKRKAQGPHQPAPMPSAGPQYTSPPFSVTSSGSGRKVNHSHARSRSGTDSRPQSRREPDPPRSSHREPVDMSVASLAIGSSPSQPREAPARPASLERQSESREGRPESRGS